MDTAAPRLDAEGPELRDGRETLGLGRELERLADGEGRERDGDDRWIDGRDLGVGRLMLRRSALGRETEGRVDGRLTLGVGRERVTAARADDCGDRCG